MDAAQRARDAPGGFNPVQVGHADIEDGDLGQFAFGGFDGLMAAVTSLSYHLKRGLVGQQGA